MSTDSEWEKWGASDPYFGVLTDPMFRNGSMTVEAREHFFSLGHQHADHVLKVCREHLHVAFSPKRVLDFGCGVGRIVIPFAAHAAEVVGVDISSSMLAEARRNCEAYRVDNATLVKSDDDLSEVAGQFDLVHSCIVIQHIEVPRGLRLFEQLVSRIAPGGAGAIQVTFGWDLYQDTYGVAPPPQAGPPQNWHRAMRSNIARLIRRPVPLQVHPNDDPEMQMNFYNLSQLSFLLHRAGITKLYSELTNHGGALGVFMFFGRPPCE